MLNVEIPQNKDKLEKQIEALKYLLKHDTREADKIIHQQALNDSEKALLEMKKEPLVKAQ